MLDVPYSHAARGSSYTWSHPPPTLTQPLALSGDRECPAQAVRLGCAPHCCLSFPFSMLCFAPITHPAVSKQHPRCVTGHRHGPTLQSHGTALWHSPVPALCCGAVTRAALAEPCAQRHARAGWLPGAGTGGKATSCHHGPRVPDPCPVPPGPFSSKVGTKGDTDATEGTKQQAP